MPLRMMAIGGLALAVCPGGGGKLIWSPSDHLPCFHSAGVSIWTRTDVALSRASTDGERAEAGMTSASGAGKRNTGSDTNIPLAYEERGVTDGE